MPKKWNVYIWVAFLVGLTLIVFSIVLWRISVHRHNVYIQSLVQNKVKMLAQEVKKNLSSTALALDRMGSRWEAQNGTPRELWIKDSARYFEHKVGAQAIGWVDSNYLVRWIMPEVGNERFMNLNMSFDKKMKALMDLSRLERKVMLTPVRPLLKEGKGIYVIVPLIVSDKPDGFIFAMIEIQPLLTSIVSIQHYRGYSVEIFDEGKRFFSNVTGENIKPGAYNASATIQLYNESWQFIIWPRSEALHGLKKAFPTWLLLFFGILISVLSFLIFIILANLKRKTQEAIEAEQLSKVFENQNQLILNSVAEGVLALNMEACVTLANKSVSRILGYSAKDLNGKSFYDILSTGDQTIKDGATEKSKIHATFSSGKTYRTDKEYFISNLGDEIPVEYVSSPIREDDRLVGVVVSFSDITKLKEAQMRNERRMRDVKFIDETLELINEATSVEEILQNFTNLTCITYHWDVGHVYKPDPKGKKELIPTKIWYVEQGIDATEFCRVTEESKFKFGIGLPGRVWMSKKPECIEDVHTDPNFSRAKVCKQLDLNSAIGVPILKDNEIFAVIEFFSGEILNKNQKILDNFSTLSRQMSERLLKWEIEKQVLFNEEKYKALIKTAVDPIILINEECIVEEFNDAASKFFDYLPDEVIGKNVNMLMPEPYHSQHDDYVKNYLRTGKKKVIGTSREVYALRKDGTEVPVYLSLSEIKIEDKHYFLGTLTVISDGSKNKERGDKK